MQGHFYENFLDKIVIFMPHLIRVQDSRTGVKSDLGGVVPTAVSTW